MFHANISKPVSSLVVQDETRGPVQRGRSSSQKISIYAETDLRVISYTVDASPCPLSGDQPITITESDARLIKARLTRLVDIYIYILNVDFDNRCLQHKSSANRFLSCPTIKRRQ